MLNKSRTFKYTASHTDALAQAVGYCRSKIAARLQIYRWLVFNVLIGNGDNHLKNISFLVDTSGIAVAPAAAAVVVASLCVSGQNWFLNESGAGPGGSRSIQ